MELEVLLAQATPGPLVEKARQHVFDLCQGKARWTMRIPAQPDIDSDFVILAALDAQANKIEAYAALERAARAHQEKRAVWIDCPVWAGPEFEAMMEAADALNEALAALDSATGEQAHG